MFLIVFILVSIQGLVSSQNENEKDDISCDNLSHIHRNFTDIIPDGEQLLAMCPDTIRSIECAIQGLSRPEQDYEFYDLDSDRELIYEMCDENSQLHKAYVNSVGCYRSMILQWPVCKAVAQDVYQDYRKFITPIENINMEEMNEVERGNEEIYLSYYEPVCLEHAYAVACLSVKILDTCGTEAHNAFVELIQRTRSVIGFCEDSAASTLRQEYLGYFESEKKHPHMDTLRALFAGYTYHP